MLSDTNAGYWGTTIVSKAGTEVTYTGSFPTARFMSLSLYGIDGYPLPAPSHFYDAELTPSAGVNPFQDGETGAGQYTVRVIAGAAPPDPAPNTLYTNTTSGRLIRVVYRVYDSGVSGDEAGGAGLPSEAVSLNGVVQNTFAGCAGSTSRVTLPAAGASPSGAPQRSRASAAPASARPQTTTAPGQQVYWTVPYPGAPSSAFADLDGSVLSTHVTPAAGDVLVFRMQVPTFPDTDAGQPPWLSGAQVRYWSLCAYDRFTDLSCLDDAHAVQGAGEATFVASTVANRPTNATAADGVNWLSLGALPTTDSFVYRQILATSAFAQSISHVKIRLVPEPTMGAYYPATAICSTAQFEQGGASACL